MKNQWIGISCVLILVWGTASQGASVGTDGGITLYLTFAGDLNTDLVVDNLGNPVNNPTTGTQWRAKDKLEHDLQLFAEHLYQMTEEKHYLRNVLVIDDDRSIANADIRWSNDAGLSSGSLNGWDDRNGRITMRRAFRQNIHEVISHEFGHYFYGLSDEYDTPAHNPNYYQGHFSGTGDFTVTITGDCRHTIMNSNNPYQFCDETDHSLTIDYTHPTTGNNITGEVLTPALLNDDNANNDGPINNWIDHPYAIDGWSVAESNHTDLIGHHTNGVRPAFKATEVPTPRIYYVDQVGQAPGRILLLDRSGSMAHESFGIKASKYVQEAGLYLYHSSEADDYIGAFVYNEQTDKLFGYGKYDSNNKLIDFYDPISLTDIHKALKTALDTLVNEHGQNKVAGGEIFLMSDGRQTTGDDLWLQVDRANDLGVTIHTFSYGDADHAVMEQIASETNGEDFLMSEKTDNLMNLKLRIIRSISKIRGQIPVYDYYGPLKTDGDNEEDIAYQIVSFNIPENCKDLKFYLFPELPEDITGDHYSFEMKHDSTGFQVQSAFSPIAKRGRFAGREIKNPRSGQWTVTILADPKLRELPEGNVQLLAYVDNPEIDAQVWMDQDVITTMPNDTQKLKVYASVSNIYPLTDVNISVYFTLPSGKKILDIQMADDGKNGDDRSEDGIYTGLVEMRRLIVMTREFSYKELSESRSLHLNLKAKFNITKDSIPAPNTEYEPQTDYKELRKSYIRSIFETTAERGVVLTMRSSQPAVKLLLLTPEGRRVFRSDKRSLEIHMDNAYPNQELMRINLGRGISITTVKSNRAKATYTIEYEVSESAEPGPRTLNLQFNGTRLKIENVIVVSD